MAENMLINIFFSLIHRSKKFSFLFCFKCWGINERWVHKTLDEHLIDTKVVVRYGFKKRSMSLTPDIVYVRIQKIILVALAMCIKYKWNNE